VSVHLNTDCFVVANCSSNVTASAGALYPSSVTLRSNQVITSGNIAVAIKVRAKLTALATTYQ